MLEKTLKIKSLTLVAIGEFNPVMYQPYWLALKKFIRDTDAADAKIQVIHNEVVKYALEIGEIEITKNRFSLTTSNISHFEPLRDLLISIFTAIEAPVTALGINHIFHCAIEDKDLYYKFGDTLSPLNNWKTKLTDPRLLQLEILENTRNDKYSGLYRIKIQPSQSIPTSQYGVSIDINDHYNLKKDDSICDFLWKNWGNSLKLAEDITESLFEKVNIK